MLTGPLLHRLAAKRKGKEKEKEKKRYLGGKVKMGIRIVIVQGIRYIPRAKKYYLLCCTKYKYDDESELFFCASSD